MSGLWLGHLLLVGHDGFYASTSDRAISRFELALLLRRPVTGTALLHTDHSLSLAVTGILAKDIADPGKVHVDRGCSRLFRGCRLLEKDMRFLFLIACKSRCVLSSVVSRFQVRKH